MSPDVADICLRASATLLTDGDAGRVVMCGSHGGRYAGELAVRARVAAIVLNDAGVGYRRAGIAALGDLDDMGIAAATVSHMSARIGDAADILDNGVISHVNASAARLGVSPGQACAFAAMRLRAAPPSVHRGPSPPRGAERRRVLRRERPDDRPIVLVDSAALVDPHRDRGAIVVTGSHGGLVDGDAERALAVEAFAAVFNDAGIGKDQAGIGRLAPLEQRGVAALTVSCASARIGDAHSTLGGRISAANARARAFGAVPGHLLRPLLREWAAAR